MAQPLTPPSPTLEVVPETTELEQTQLVAQIPSFRDMLMNSGEGGDGVEEEDDLVLRSEDVILGMNGSIPTIDFATHVLEALNKKMGFTVVVKLLGRRIEYRHLRSRLQSLWKPSGPFQLTDLKENCFLVRFKNDLDFQHALTGGPWVIFGHYLSVQAWTPSFKPREHTISEIVAWIRLPQLPARYYSKRIIRSIGNVVGDVIHIDYNTESGDRRKFARMAVSLDLTKPLVSKLQVDGEMIYVEYEGLPTICFHCGKYGHVQDSCPDKPPPEVPPLSRSRKPQRRVPPTRGKCVRTPPLESGWWCLATNASHAERWTIRLLRWGHAMPF